VTRGLDELDRYIGVMMERAGAFRFAEILGSATPFRKAMYLLAIAWMHLWSMTVSVPKVRVLVGNVQGDELKAILEDDNEAAFYYGRTLSSRFFLRDEFPQFFGMMEGLFNNEESLREALPEVFTGTIEM